MRLARVRLMSVLGGVVMLAGILASPAAAQLPTMDDPRVGLSPGLDNAGVAKQGLDLRNLSQEELIAYWNLWLHQAQVTNDLDEDLYSPGVFERAPGSSIRRPRSTTIPVNTLCGTP